MQQDESATSKPKVGRVVRSKGRISSSSNALAMTSRAPADNDAITKVKPPIWVQDEPGRTMYCGPKSKAEAALASIPAEGMCKCGSRPWPVQCCRR